MIFLNGINLDQNIDMYQCCAGKSKLGALLNSQSEKTRLVFRVPHANWHHPTVKQSEHTKYNTNYTVHW